MDYPRNIPRTYKIHDGEGGRGHNGDHGDNGNKRNTWAVRYPLKKKHQYHQIPGDYGYYL